MCESFFATLECDLMDRSSFLSQRGRRVVFHLVEGFYTPLRRYSAVGYL